MFSAFAATPDAENLLWLGVVTLLLGWPLVIALHEWGHAIPALLFTRGEVTIVFGTRTPTFNPAVLQSGRLRMVVYWEFFRWDDNFTLHAREALSTAVKRAIILGGPLLPVLAFGALGAWGYWGDWHAAWLILFTVLGCMSIGSAVWNLRYSDVPLDVQQGRFTFNDGFQLRAAGRDSAIAENRFSRAFTLAQQQHAARQFDDAIQSAQLLVKHNLFWPELLHILTDSHYQTGQYEASKHYARMMKALFPQWVEELNSQGSRPAGVGLQ